MHIKSTKIVQDRWQSNTMKIKIDSMEEVSAFLAKSKYGDFRAADAYSIEPGMTRSFTRLNGQEEFWILYEPKKFRGGKIKVTAWVDHIETPQKEKAYTLALEAADRKAAEATEAQR